MSTQQDNDGTERRIRTRVMVDKWLAERQEMLVLYCQLAGLEPYTPERSSKDLLRRFCQVLVDYIAFGHFEVYNRISQGDERRTRVLQVAEEVYPKIAEVAEISVAFNDKYDTENHEQAMDQLDEDLSMLGVQLASRIELEDRVVKALLR
ncbi:MAG: Rsd/AlgQ family anti-sigma factor [Chromatiaceae bacterium]|nr:Rsd/AlgQ family anti-sigma factor [Gammaproteobacteria bacterium]MCB1871570.1 Rsd/AlgQ family anti-sigma factor [Gammaproteobacteria bacterium]MCB1880617.1 Rsd/AlgQ family anti-sigma factor [Gammaproteobacteria bacterium]MCB1902996.1 Rsd/AlgQ family anti-sigma factor [Gammaproteobacteria bacterium]MCP5448510.1 Rsd/AlgQ family anti-sigma factor [Chromatiaceae bacterium]